MVQHPGELPRARELYLLHLIDQLRRPARRLEHNNHYGSQDGVGSPWQTASNLAKRKLIELVRRQRVRTHARRQRVDMR